MIIFWLLLGLLGAISLIALTRIQSDYEQYVLAAGLAIVACILVRKSVSLT